MTPTVRRTPFVYWAQDEENISLRVDVRNAQNIETRVSEDGLMFGFEATSMENASSPDASELDYAFQLSLSEPLQEPVEVKMLENCVELRLRKRCQGFWKNGILSTTAQREAHKWLKFDFEKWRDDPEDEKELDGDELAKAEDDNFRKNAYLEKMLREMEQERGGMSLMSDEEFAQRMNLIYGTYMFVYNVGMFIINFAVLCMILYRFASTPKAEFLSHFWADYFQTLVAITCLQYLDVFHSLSGLTKAGYKTSLLQITGRLSMLFIINGCATSTKSSAVFSLIITYLLSEQFRYPYYALNSAGISIHPVTFLRYNAWLLLYPIGMFLEGLIMVLAIPHYLHSGVYSLQMPNAINMSFNFGVFLAIFVTTCFPFIAFTLLRHMHRQRRMKMAEMGKMEHKLKKEA